MTPPNLAGIEPAFFIVFSLCLGLIVGSFLNVVIHRLPKMMESEFRHECAVIDLPEGAEEPARPRYNLAVPRSACPGCGALITARDNVPVLSWLWLRGRCRHCQTAISPRYPLVELATGLLTAAMAWHFGPSLLAVGAILLVWFLVALFCIDADTYLLPDSLTLPLLWLGLLFNLNGIFVPLQDAVIGAMAGYLLLWLVYWAFKLVTGKDGMGYGDFKLLAALGAWMGWQCLPVIILMSSVAGTIIGISLILLARRGWGKPLPFGPYLAIAGLATLFWGPQLQRLIWGAY